MGFSGLLIVSAGSILFFFKLFLAVESLMGKKQKSFLGSIHEDEQHNFAFLSIGQLKSRQFLNKHSQMR